MPRKPNAKGASILDGSEKDGHHLTSGDMARMLHVDLKTIHNWVNQGHISGRRTKGRHLRFDRIEVVRFMRQYGYPIPDAVGALLPRVVLDKVSGSKPGIKRALGRGCELTAADGLYACALAVASGDQEIVVFDLDHRDAKQLKQFIGAVRDWSVASRISLVGIGKPAARRMFLAIGGDIAVPTGTESELRNIARWLTGGTETEPEAAEMRGHG